MYFVTSNALKFAHALNQLKPYGIEIEQVSLDLNEIQSDSVEKIASHKAMSAFTELKTPLIVSDVEWNIPALNGFPGAFMAYVDKWFGTEDFLRLMQGIEDRRILCTEVLVYIDCDQSKTFKETAEGVILLECSGTTDYKSADPIISFRSDRKSLTQARSEKIPTSDKDLKIWDKFAHWFNQI